MISKKICKLKYFIPSLFWMIIIFIFSNEPGHVSSGKNNFIVNILASFSKDMVEFIGYDLLNFLIRKVAHVTEYLILFLLIYYGIYKFYKLKAFKATLVTFIITVAYACSDEIHQLFIIGREGKLVDIFIDSIGGLIGIVIIFILKKLNKI